MFRATCCVFRWWFVAWLLPGAATDWGQAATLAPDPPALEPAASLEQITLHRGYSLQLVAAEPMVADPVAIDWGPDGRLWVVEMADYPYGIDGNGKPGGRVRYLEDADGDGQYDRSTVFLEGISFPTAVMPWRDGVLVTAAPELFFARDTDGDGRADEHTVLFRGFMEGNQQLRVNGLRYGLDNWVYCAAGGHHAGFGAENSIEVAATQMPIPLGSRDFRFDPNTLELEPQSGPSQFGRVRDDWNHWFGVQNSYPLWHYVLEDAYLRRNPAGRYPDVRQQLRLPANPPVFARKQAEKRYHSFEHAGHYTSACGPCIYRDDLLFPARDVTHAFTCEPFHNVVQHHELRDNGVTFVGQRAATNEPYDFFASADYWTRPVMARTGPDGALWIVDMYRYMIEHPDWLPPEGRAELLPYYRAGEGMGRIYRVFPSSRPLRRIPCLASLSNDQLVDQLASRNGPVRDMAQRLLIERQAVDTAAQLQQVAADHTDARARLHAIYTLAGLDRSVTRGPVASTTQGNKRFLTDALLAQRFHDSHAEVRRHAVRLAESRMGDSPKFVAALAKLTDDPSVKVRMQVALSMGATGAPEATEAIVKLARRDDLDAFQLAAIVSSVPSHLAALVDASVQPVAMHPQLRRTLLQQTIARPDLALRVLQPLLPPEGTPTIDQLHRLADWLDALRDEGLSVAQWAAQAGEAAPATLQPLPNLWTQCWEVGLDPDAALPQRVAALRLVVHDREHHAAYGARCQELLSPQSPTEIQLLAVTILSQSLTERTVAHLLANWSSALPPVRAAIVDQLLRERGATLELLAHVEKGSVAQPDLDAVRRDRLLHHRDTVIAQRAAEVFQHAVNPQRAVVLERYQAARTADTDVARGQRLFEKHCAVCHTSTPETPAIGPELKSLSDRSHTNLAAAILDPSRAVEPQYLGYHLELKSGEVVYGLIVGQSGHTLQVRQLDGKTRELPRSAIDVLSSSQRSFMPEGFEAELSPQDLADVIRYVQQL